MLKTLAVGALAAVVALTAVPAEARHIRHARHVTYAHDCKPAAHRGRNGGAILGALAGQAIGHNTSSTLIGAGVGAVAGHNVRYSNCRHRYG